MGGTDMHVVCAWDGDRRFGDALVRRLRDHGFDVDDTAHEPRATRRDVDAAIDGTIAFAGKADALRALEARIDRDTPILSCCHAASATRTASLADVPRRVVGFALLPPLDGRATVEAARALQTSDEAAQRAERGWTQAGLESVWVADGAGLVLPRIVSCLANEALFAVQEGTSSSNEIDLAMRLGTRYPQGPIRWAETIGLANVLATLDALRDEHGDDRYRAAPLLRRLVAAGCDSVDRPSGGVPAS
jgi:3-hydroxybutyryl-CoA dehydrogenase